jgi:archaellum component FlaC
MTKDQKNKIIAALESGRDSAKNEANTYHENMKGYRKSCHDMMDGYVNEIDEAIKMVKLIECTDA